MLVVVNERSQKALYAANHNKMIVNSSRTCDEAVLIIQMDLSSAS